MAIQVLDGADPAVVALHGELFGLRSDWHHMILRAQAMLKRTRRGEHPVIDLAADGNWAALDQLLDDLEASDGC